MLTVPQLESLHIDHGFEVVHICEVWSEALKQTSDHHVPPQVINHSLLMHLLFNFEGQLDANTDYRGKRRRDLEYGKNSNLKFRCKECHNTASAHYSHQLKVDDILE